MTVCFYIGRNIWLFVPLTIYRWQLLDLFVFYFLDENKDQLLLYYTLLLRYYNMFNYVTTKQSWISR